MARTIEKLVEYKKVERVILAETREYEYDFRQTRLLMEIANAIQLIDKKHLTSLRNISIPGCDRCVAGRLALLRSILEMLRYDPYEAYKRLAREIRHVQTRMKRDASERCVACYTHYLRNCLIPMKSILERCELIRLASGIKGARGRAIYREIFSPTIRPNFMFTRFMLVPPANGELVDRYRVEDSLVEIYRVPGRTRFVYHLTPPEFRLSEDEYTLLDAARRYLAAHRPRVPELTRPERLRETFFNISRDLLADLASQFNLTLSVEKLEQLANILTRYTAGLGILELLLSDEKIQDISVNAPIGIIPIYVFHQDFEECETNLIPSREDAEAWATRLRLQSGRPLDEANPVLDTELLVPGGRARVCAITRTLSPYGLAFALRRHRASPWTFPLFVKNRFFSPLAAGLLWFLIDNARTMLIAGTRGSGKTSLLGACLLQIMPKSRIVVLEDSVTGDCELFIKVDGNFRRVRVGEFFEELAKEQGCLELEDGREVVYPSSDVEVFSVDESGRLVLAKATAFARHKTRKRIYEITTRTGRKVKVTEDHSLFTIGEQTIMREVKASELKRGDYIAVPRILRFESHLGMRDLITLLDEEELSSTSLQEGIGVSTKLKLDEKFMEFLGLWLAKGRYENASSLLVRVDDSACRAIVEEVAKRFGISYELCGDGVTIRLRSRLLVKLMKKMDFRGSSKRRRIPSLVFILGEDLRAALLRGLFSESGKVNEEGITISLSSRNLLKDVQALLLGFGIVSEIKWKKEMNRATRLSISASEFIDEFASKIGFLQPVKQAKLRSLLKRRKASNTMDVIPLSAKSKLELVSLIKDPNFYDHVAKSNGIAREVLRRIVLQNKISANPISILPFTDLFWDEVKEIKVKAEETYVYDISVPPFENFVCENIVVHNTLELPVATLRELGYNVQHLKCRSIITQVETELPADEALRTALRLGDSCLIVGEVRSIEAKALYEAMRIGALANVVAGTIHGDSPYGVFDRVVNDLGVPPTSFKATDIIVIANRLRTPDGLRSFRRVVEIAEVRKHWQRDPLEEHGFVDLMQYSAKEDELKPTQTLLIGESQVLQAIGERVREWRGKWEAMWSNILLRAKVMETLARFAEAKPELAEAEFVVRSNEMFHLISQQVLDELDVLDSNEIYNRWLNWLKTQA